MGKTEAAIQGLPDNPSKHIYWIVYNQDMVSFMTKRIKEVKGDAYMKHVTVVAKGDPSKDRTNGLIYFDPSLMDLIGNGS